MPAFSSITLNDGAGTPVAHVFGPDTRELDRTSFADRSGGISVGYPTVQFQTSVPSKASRLYKVRAKIVMPVLEVVNSSTYSGITPAPTKAYDMTAEVVFYAPERSTLQNRKDIRAFMKNLLSDAVITTLVETQESAFY